MVPERSQMGSRRPLESIWGSGMRPEPISLVSDQQFWTNFGSEFGRVLLLKLPPVGLPNPKWTPKAVWTPFGSVQGPFWDHF